MKGILASMLAMIVITSATFLLAAQSTGGGPPGTNFSCDVNKSVCKCEGHINGADCKAMAKNCDKSTECNSKGRSCPMAKRKAPPQKGGFQKPSGAGKSNEPVQTAGNVFGESGVPSQQAQ